GAALGYRLGECALGVGVALLGALAAFVGLGPLVVDTARARPLSVPTLRPPSWQYPLGTDRQGRDLLAVMVAGTPLTLRIGFIAGLIGAGLGSALGFSSGYSRVSGDAVIQGLVDAGLPIPPLLLLFIN